MLFSRLPLLLLPAVVTWAAAGPIPASHVLHERRGLDEVRGWVKRDRVAAHVQLPVRIGLQQNHGAMEAAHDWLMDVSHPASKKYGQHWTQNEVIEAFRPTDDTVEAVKQWLTTEGGIAGYRITHTDNKAWLAFDASTQEMEKLLHAEFHEHQHEFSAESMISCDEYHIPAHLREYIDYITPGVKGIRLRGAELQKRQWQPGPGMHRPRPPFQPFPGGMPWDHKTPLKNCDELITPACIQALYHFEPQDPHAEVSPNNSMGIFEASTAYLQEDLNDFYKKFTPYIPQGTKPIFDPIDGGVSPVQTKKLGVNAEADLDLQLAIPIVYPQSTTDFQTDDYYSYKYEGEFNTFFDGIDGSYCTYSAYGETGDAPGLDPVYPDPHKGKYSYKGKLQCGIYKPTNVISISYGVYEQDLPYYYQRRQCNEALKLGLQGVSIMIATGDTGVGGDNTDTRDGCLRNGRVFDPTQLCTCPYVTNVGATKVERNHTVFEPEVAALIDNFYSSTGGFSNIFTIPDYQKSAIAEYFKNHDPPYPYYYDGKYNSSKGIYNRNGRGIPDVAANGQNIAVYLNGKPGKLDGTSASCPIFAGLINRIIEERIKAGKGPLGFINPVLYEHPEVLNDITEGQNPGCHTQGFSAVEGWDPVTGLGTPNYPKMLELFLSLP